MSILPLIYLQLLAFVHIHLASAIPPRPASSGAPPRDPIILSSTGGFSIGGKILVNPQDNRTTLSCDHGYFEYFYPVRQRKTSLVMWHSASTQAWQNRWDGGEGFKDMFLRRNYRVYLWDGPRIGRANWACEPWTYELSYRDQGNFAAWDFGPQYPDWYDDVKFPKENREYWWQMATQTRYVEFDTIKNVHLETDVAALAADSGEVGDRIVYLTNSAGGLRAMMTATKAQKNHIKGIVTYESVGYVYPDNAGIEQGGAFGPFVVPLADFRKLALVPKIQFVFGDHRDESYLYLQQARQAAKLINQYGGNAEVLLLGEIPGFEGSTHTPFADMHNDKIAGLLDDFLAETKLDHY